LNNQDSLKRAVAFVSAANPNAIGNGLEESAHVMMKEQTNSPGRVKNKVGALYNPNYIDPRVINNSA